MKCEIVKKALLNSDLLKDRQRYKTFTFLFPHHNEYVKEEKKTTDGTYVLRLKRMVNLISGYPDANICGYPTDSDIINLVLLAMYFNLLLPARLNIVA